MSKRSRKRKKHASVRRRKQETTRRRTAPPRGRNERVLQERIQRFAYQNRFKADFERALRLYFGEDALQDDVLTMDENEIPGFQEWYIHDYVTFDEKERIIDLFAGEMGVRLPQSQRQILDDWRRVNRWRLFEVQAVEPGVGVTVQDLLSGEVLEVNDISVSYIAIKWQILLARPLLTNGRLNFTGISVPRPPMEKRDLLGFAEELWKKYQTQHPQASLDDFYRDHGLDIYHYMIEIATAMPSVYTSEGHPIMSSTARYAVADHGAAEERLDRAEEFIYVGPAAEDETTLTYTWLLRGRSRVPEVPIEGRGMIMRTEWTGESDYRSLGDVQLRLDHLELHCFSQERLAAGKALLKQILGDLIQHQSDELKDMDAILASDEHLPPSQAKEMPPEISEALARKLADDWRAMWLDDPVPALDGKSPREAASDPAMREKIEELLKTIEYVEERKRRAGEHHIDVADLRREMGLPQG